MFVGFLFFIAVFLTYRSLKALSNRGQTKAVVPGRQQSPRLVQLVQYADRLYSERKYHQAEKTYLEVLKLSHKHVHAYTKLGMIYSTLKSFDDAIECFQIAARLEPSAASFNNLGLVFFENQNYVKAIAAFEKAIMFEPSASRYVGLARAHQKMTNHTKAVIALEKAAQLEPKPKFLLLLAEAYVNNKDRLKAEETYRRIIELDPDNSQAQRFFRLAQET